MNSLIRMIEYILQVYSRVVFFQKVHSYQSGDEKYDSPEQLNI